MLGSATLTTRLSSTPMKSATDNADKMGKKLTQDYNRARQSQITSELSELMGGVEAMKEDYRAEGGLVMIENFAQDVRYAIRSLTRTKGLTAFVIFTLALGIGMASGTFSMVDALIFRPYPVPQPNEMVTIVGTTRDSNYEHFSYREYLDIRDKSQSYAGVVANADLEEVGFSASPTETPSSYRSPPPGRLHPVA